MKVRLCGVDQVADQEMIQARVDGHEPFAVYHVHGQFYVTDDTCTHGKASLSDEGELEDCTITCTWHDGQYDIRTGEVLSAPCTVPIRSYPVTIESDAVWIDVDP